MHESPGGGNRKHLFPTVSQTSHHSFFFVFFSWLWAAFSLSKRSAFGQNFRTTFGQHSDRTCSVLNRARYGPSTSTSLLPFFMVIMGPRTCQHFGNRLNSLLHTVLVDPPHLMFKCAANPPGPSCGAVSALSIPKSQMLAIPQARSCGRVPLEMGL